METFSAFLEQLNDTAQRIRTEEVLAWVMGCFSHLVPKIAWNQPIFTDHGTFIIGFSAAKHHLAVAPERAAVERFSREIQQTGYQHTKEVIRIRWTDPVDYGLLERIIQFNIADKADCTTFWRRPRHT